MANHYFVTEIQYLYYQRLIFFAVVGFIYLFYVKSRFSRSCDAFFYLLSTQLSIMLRHQRGLVDMALTAIPT